MFQQGCFHSRPLAGAAMTRFHHAMEVSGAVIAKVSNAGTSTFKVHLAALWP